MLQRPPTTSAPAPAPSPQQITEAEMSSAVIVTDETAEAFVARYARLPRWVRCRRFLFAARRSSDGTQKVLLGRLAMREARGGLDTRSYREGCELAGEQPDLTWISQTDDQCRGFQERYEQDLQAKRWACGSGNAAAKDSVWDAYAKLGDLLFDKGDGPQAMKCFVRMRDYAGTPKRTAAVCCRVACAAGAVNNWAHAASYASKADHYTKDIDDPNIKRIVVSLHVAGALAQIDNKHYDPAAKALIDVLTKHGGDLSSSGSSGKTSTGNEPEAKETFETACDWDLTSWRDVTAYACLCAIATFSRSSLRESIVDHARFKHRAKSLHPFAVDAALDAHKGKYATAMAHLDKLRDELKLDPIFAKHASALRDLCADKCVAQYCAPYSVVSLAAAAKTFNVDKAKFEHLVAKLIFDGKLKAKIDRINDTVIADEPTEREIALDHVLKQGAAYRREIRALMLRMSCLENDFIVRGTIDHDGDQRDHRGSSGKYHTRSGTRSLFGSSGGDPRTRRHYFDDDDDDDDADAGVVPSSNPPVLPSPAPPAPEQDRSFYPNDAVPMDADDDDDMDVDNRFH